MLSAWHEKITAEFSCGHTKPLKFVDKLARVHCKPQTSQIEQRKRFKVSVWVLQRDEKVPDFVFTRRHQGLEPFSSGTIEESFSNRSG